MDATMAADVRDRFVFVRERTAPPTGFPDLPDIPLARYADEEFFRAEVDRVFRGSWHFAGHESEWDGPGSYRVLDLPYAPVVMTRGRDGQLRRSSARVATGAPGRPAELPGTAIWHLHAELDRWLGDAVPAELRIPDLLAGYVEP